MRPTHRRRGLNPWPSTQGLCGRRPSFQGCNFARTQVCLDPGALPRSTLRGLQPPPAEEATGDPEAPRSQCLGNGCAGLWLRFRKLSLCQMMSSHPAARSSLYGILRPILTCFIEFLAGVSPSVYLFDSILFCPGERKADSQNNGTGKLVRSVAFLGGRILSCK